jgi:cobalt-zinc-cadmium resistance protein CzcA
LAATRSKLPEGIEPELGPLTSGSGSIFTYSVEAAVDARQANGKPYDAMALREVQDWIIKPQLAQVKGVVEINSIGGFDKEFHVLPDPLKLLQYGLSLEDVNRALIANNNNQGAGFIERQGQQILVRSPGQLQSLNDIAQVVVGEVRGAPVLVKDVAEVMLGKELRTGAATRNGHETVLGTAMMLVGENPRTVAIALAQKLQEINPTLPKGVSAEVVYNRTTLVDKTIKTVQQNLLEGALLVIVVLFFLLGNLRAALITAAGIPLSMLATLFGMLKTGVSANLMSLGALDFGLIVDGAVIIVENGIRRLGEAQRLQTLPLKERLELVYEATAEVIRPSLFGVLIITLVYVPIFALTGVEGKMFHPMAATVVMALLAAMLLSLTFVPAMVALFMTGKVQDKEPRIMQAAKSLYEPVLRFFLLKRAWVLGSASALVALCLWLFTTLGSEFVPQLDEGDIALHAMRINGTSLEQSVRMQEQLEQHILSFPEVDKVFAQIGTPDVATDPMPPNVADVFVILKPHSAWPDPKRSKADLVEALEHKLEALPGNNYEFTQPIEMRFNELISGVRSDLGIKLYGDDLAVLETQAQKVLQVLNQVPGVADAKAEVLSGQPMLVVKPKRVALAQYGVSLETVQATVTTAIGGQQVGFIYQGDRRFNLVVRLPESLRNNPQKLAQLPVPFAEGYVPLNELAELVMEPAPSQVNRENGKRYITITANVRERSLGDFVQEVKTQVATQVQLPAGYWLDYGGTFKQLESASARLGWIVPMTLVLILGLLVMAFQSFKDALIIFTGVPLALTGGVLMLWLRDMPLSISAGVGFIALSGVAVLNGLVMLSFMRSLSNEYPLEQAVIQGALTRLRPVLMTALVAGLGFVPMALNTGVGAEVQRPLATVVIGGILSSTLLTLILLPVLYYWAHSKAHKLD